MEIREKVYTDKQEKIARYSKALGHPVRVFIMDFLVKNTDKCCYSGDMAEELPIARSTLSQHLKELKEAGLIRGQIEGVKTNYCLDAEKINAMKSAVLSFLGEIEIQEGLTCK